MKKISIEEADKILAAHRPKETSCPYCGVNLKDRMIPISLIQQRIKEIQDHTKLNPSWKYENEMVIAELENLLKPTEEKK